MTTRFYLARTTVAAVSPAFDAAWTSTGSAVRRALLREYDGSALTNGSTISWTSGDVALDRQYVSPPLAAQTLSGSVRLQIRAREIAGTDNVRPYIGIHVFSEDGTTYRATLLAVGFHSSVTELPTTQTNTTFVNGTFTSYTCVDGDRIVVEIGYSDVAGTTPQALARYGAPSAPDFGENNTDTSDLTPWVEFHTSLEFPPVWGSPNQTLEWSYGSKSSTSREVWGSPNQTLEYSYGSRHYGPIVRDMSPSSCDVCVPTTASLSFAAVTTLPTTVNTATLVVTFIINGTPVVVYNGGFQPGYSGTLTPAPTATEDIYLFDVTPDAGFPGSAEIVVTVAVSDSLAVAMAPPVSWCFCIVAAAPLPPTAPAFRVVPPEASIRGGTPVVIAGDDDLVDTSRNVDFLATLGGFTASNTGSGAVAWTLNVGARLDTGRTRMSLARLVSPDDYANVDAEVQVRIPPTALGTLAALEATTGSGASCRVLIERTVTGTLARGDYNRGTGVQPGGAEAYRGGRIAQLRLVRNETRIYGFVEGVPVLVLSDFPADEGALRVYAVNNVVSERVESTLLAFWARAHARIGENLLVDKVELGPRRLYGRVPETTVDLVGPTDVTAFGIYGTSTLVEGFTYVLPAERTFSSVRSAKVVQVQDPVMKDGD